MLLVPLTFDPPSWDWEESGHLQIEPRATETLVVWRHLDLHIAHPGDPGWPSFDDVQHHTPGLKFHGRCGFSLDRFHEFFLDVVPQYAAFRFGSVEVTFGEPTPMLAYMFDSVHDEHVHGEWEHLASVRICGCTVEEVELVLLSALTKYEERLKVMPTLWEMEDFDYYEPEPAHSELTSVVDFPSGVPGDIEPMRFMYYAKRSAEPASACILLYRVLEYYAYFSLSQKMGSIRRDGSLSDRDFLVQAGQLLTKDEKAPIVRLIAGLATPELLTSAVEKRLIPAPDRSLLGNATYEFRNSIVHAKTDHRAEIKVDPVLSPPNETNSWRQTLIILATRAISINATKRTVGA